MTALPQHKLTVEEFLAWAEVQPKEAGRFELWDGQVIQTRGAAGTMNSERANHWKRKAALYRALYQAFATARLKGDVVIDGASVKLPNNRAVEPDVLIYLGPEVPGDALVVPEPIIVCEVLSPSTAKHDTSTKLEGYFELPSIQHYLIVDPDKPLLIHHTRAEGDTLRTRIISDAAHPLQLDPPGLSVDLTEVLSEPT
ncbi:MAG: Uma2 family endonuclease [Alphaproteobacteria bacterium]|nr:Uma2 family endonuclease [Alphaproteobacteria bacterium]